MTVARDVARERVARHDFSPTDLNCRRCHRSYRSIVADDPDCEPDVLVIVAEPDMDRRPQQIKSRTGGPNRQAHGPGYVDPDRPQLSWVRFVCEPSLRAALIEIAETENVSMSEVARRACRRYVGMPE